MELEGYFEFIGVDAIRIAGTRVGIETVLCDYREGASPEEIVLRYPTLSLRASTRDHHLLSGESGEVGVLSGACETATGRSLAGATTPSI